MNELYLRLIISVWSGVGVGDQDLALFNQQKQQILKVVTLRQCAVSDDIRQTIVFFFHQSGIAGTGGARRHDV